MEDQELKGEKLMKTNAILFAFAIAVIAAFGLLAAASNHAYAEQVSSSPFTALSSSDGSSATIELVRGPGGGRSHGGRAFRGGHSFHGGRGFRGGHFRRHFGPYFYGGWGGAYYVDPYYREPYCLDLTWDSDLNRWVCNVFY